MRRRRGEQQWPIVVERADGRRIVALVAARDPSEAMQVLRRGYRRMLPRLARPRVLAPESPGTYERIGIAIDRERTRNPLDEQGRPRWLYTEHARVLAPFGDLVYAAARLIQDLSDEDLERLAESEHLVSEINCSWAAYVSARASWLQREVRWERSRRARLREASEASA